MAGRNLGGGKKNSGFSIIREDDKFEKIREAERLERAWKDLEKQTEWEEGAERYQKKWDEAMLLPQIGRAHV